MIVPSERANALDFSVTRGEKIQIALTYTAIVTATAIAFIASFVVGQLSPVLAGLGFVAYVFGLRHGVDADHIAAIDNTTRKLMQENKGRFTVGMWFSLGHSAIVVALIVAIVLATRAVVREIPAARSAGEVLGLLVSGVFLIVIGLINVFIVMGIYRVFVQVRAGKGRVDARELEELLDKRGGMLNRLFRSLYKLVREPWQIFPIGVLFGLGFDTATEVALIGISVGIGVSSTIPIWMILILPFMFTCGMVLVDTTDGAVMRLAYGWAFIHPMRKIYYNLTVTLVSIAVAFGIGGIELLLLIANRFNFSGLFWDSLRNLDFEVLGFAIIGLFLFAWTVSVAYWKYKRYDELFATG